MRRLLFVLFSLALHAGAAGTLYLFSQERATAEERVYHVSLAEFAPVAAPLPAVREAVPPPAPEPEPPLPVVAPEPEPEPPRPKEPETRTISAKKKMEPPKARQSEKAAPPAPRAPEGDPGPTPRQIGGLAAYQADHVDQRPSIARRVAPEYPGKARRMQVEGQVVVQLVVDASGTPKACRVQSATPPGYFEDAALVAANKMRFIPGKIKGRAVNTLVHVPFAFRLR